MAANGVPVQSWQYSSFEQPMVAWNGTTNTAVGVALNNILSGTTYHFRAVAVGDGMAYGGHLTFTTGSVPAVAPNMPWMMSPMPSRIRLKPMYLLSP